jgi:hypothetical protein
MIFWDINNFTKIATSQQLLLLFFELMILVPKKLGSEDKLSKKINITIAGKCIDQHSYHIFIKKYSTKCSLIKIFYNMCNR